jgi:biotin-dependent carboxylase-like uncharacterized protein
MPHVVVTRVGFSASFQDRGRQGFSDLGLGAAGAADGSSARLANRMLGNPPEAAVIESVLGALELRAVGTLLVVVTGAMCPVAVQRFDGRGIRSAAPFEVITLEPGHSLVLGTADSGLRSYVAVRGGFDVEPVLGSRSWDSLAALGPPPISEGDIVPVGDLATGWPLVDAVPPQQDPAPGEAVVLSAVPGPRDDWFTETWRASLTGQTYRVGSDSDRVGMRLTGDEPLVRRRAEELPSEGMELGSLQVPPEGYPVVFLADHPVTGGYPVVAVLADESIDRAAQLRPGDAVRIRLL